MTARDEMKSARPKKLAELTAGAVLSCLYDVAVPGGGGAGLELHLIAGTEPMNRPMCFDST